MVCAVSYAADNGGNKTYRYLPQRFGPTDGLSGGSVNAIAQTQDGYLWIGTDQTLWRFDGHAFEPVSLDPELGPMTRVVSLTVDKQGALWILRRGQPLVRYQQGEFSVAPWTVGVQVGITAIGPALHSGVVMSALEPGVGRSNGATFERLAPPPISVVLSITQTSDGKFWLGTNDSGLLYLQGHDTLPSGVRLPDNKVNCLLAGKAGQLWIGTDRGLVLWTGTEISRQRMPESLDRAQVLSMILDRHDDLWVGTAKGLLRYHAGTVSSLTPANDTLAPAVTALFEDREGNVWAGDSLGMQRWRETALETFSRADGLPADSYGSIAMDSAGRTWIAPVGGGLFWLREGQPHRLIAGGIGTDKIYSIAAVDTDDLWLGRQGGGLTHLHLAGGKIDSTTYRTKDGLAQDSIFTVHADREGGIWAGSVNAGASHLKDGHFTTYSSANGLPSNSISSIAETADGTIWLATPNGLASLSRNTWHNYSTGEGLPSSNVTALYVDREGMLWIGTSDGLIHADSGRIGSTAPCPELSHQAIFGMAEDDTGSLWIATSNRLLRIKRVNLLNCRVSPGDLRDLALAGRPYDTEGIQRDQTLITDTLGRIWVSTNLGLSVITPELLDDRSVPGIVHIVGMTVDGSIVKPADHLDIAPGKHRITFNYVGLSLAAPDQVRYKFRLDNYDREWSEPSEEKQATYTNLIPGKYSFHVIASNSGGQWSGSEDTLQMTVRPLLWQTNRFRFLVAGLLILIGIGAYRVWVRQITREIAVGFQERLAERTRIAQELHDTLLQGFFSASLLLNTATNQVPADSPARSLLHRAQELMDKVMDEGRTAVRGLRTAELSPQSLEENFRKLLDETAGVTHVKSAVVAKGPSRSLNPFIYDEVVRIGREALLNSRRHSNASNIGVEIQYSTKQFQIEFADDGSGIDPKILLHGREGHWGLAGMHERAAKIGAKFTICSDIQTGTKLRLVIPGNVAFRPNSETRLWRRLTRHFSHDD